MGVWAARRAAGHGKGRAMYRERPTRRRARSATTGSPLESLEARTYFAVHAFFVAGRLSVFGQGGADLLTGGDGNDALTGGPDNDMVFGQAGDDNLFWGPGDGSDRNEGGDGIDTVVVNGAAASEHFTAAPNGERVRFERTD